MRPSIFSSFDYDIPFAESVSLISAAGFKVIALGPSRQSRYDTSGGLENIASALARRRMDVNSVHAPFPEGDNLFSLEEGKRSESVQQCKLAIEASAYLNAGPVAIHLIPGGFAPGQEKKVIDRGIDSIGILLEHAANKGVSLGFENGQTEKYDRMLEMLLEEFKGPQAGICYDTGHENIKCGGFDILKKYSHRLNSLHVHDNRGDKDLHMLPYEGNINWNQFRDILKDLGSGPDICIEAHPSGSEFKTPASFLQEAFVRAEKLLV